MNIELNTSEVLSPSCHGDNETVPEPIAIIGIGCRLPGGVNDPESYWKLLHDGVDAITEIPKDRWDPSVFYDPEPGKAGKTNARWGGFLSEIDQFDSHFFGISPREAARMDPQQRLLLEVAWEALEDAGLALEGIAESKTSVYVGISSYDYQNLQASGDRDKIDVYTNTGGALSIAANRISYCFNFKGPSMAVDTACSSALVAVHLACQSMWYDDCTMALAGGVNVLISPDGYIGFSRLSMLSPDGRCKAFDARANGFVRSEGAGMVVLKPLSRALADKDRIYALIRATGVNQDGRTPGMTVPSQESQAALLRDTCRLARITPGAIQYVEAHGTGTLVGDPIEARALGAELSIGRPRGGSCIIGSVKSNIGHLESASGIAGLIKVALALKQRQIPANLHFDQPNPEIPFEALRLRVPRTLEPWPPSDGPALAGINSFGFGGTNAHAILQGVPLEDDKVTGWQGDKVTEEGSPLLSSVTLSPCHPVTLSPCHLLPLSARSAEALPLLARSYVKFLQTEGERISLADICFNAGVRRSHHSHRLAFVAQSRAELLEQLAAVGAGETHPRVVSGHVEKGQSHGLAFVCSGQGPQWWAMGRQLLTQEPVFRAVIEECDELVRNLGGWSLWKELTADESASRLQETRIAQPAIFAIQAALAKLWQSWGVVPDAVVGHSVGEVAAGYLAGVFTLEEAVRVIFHRGRCMDFAPGSGKMLAVGLGLEDAQRLIELYGDQVSIAAVNSPTSLTLSGDAGILDAVAARLQKQDVFCRFLQVQYAFHSAQMDPVREPLLHALADLQPQPAQLPLFSTVTGQRVAGPEWDAEYWWRNVRQGVRFTDAVDRLLETNHFTFVELSAHPVLASAVAECLTQRSHKGVVTPSLRRKEEERSTMLRSLGVLYTRGRAVAWDRVLPGGGRFVRLPSYPWRRESFWHESEASRTFRLPGKGHPLLGRLLRTPTPSWQSVLEPRLLPYLADHRVRGHVVLPATAYLEMGLAAGKAVLDGGCSVIEEVQLVKACFLPEKDNQTMHTVWNPTDATFTVYGRTQDASPKWVAHAKGVLRSRPLDAPPAVNLDEVRRRCPVEITRADCYSRLKNVGLEYGPLFQGVQRMWQGKGEALGQVQPPEAVQAEVNDYLVHPAILDACIQVIFGVLPDGSDTRGVYLPVEIERVRVHGSLSGPLWCHAQLVEKTRQGLSANLHIFEESGKLLVELRGLRCQSVGESGDGAEKLDDLLYEYQWQLQPRAGQEPAAPSEGVLPAPSQLAESVQAEAGRLCVKQRVKERYLELDPRRDAVCTGWIWAALEQLGADLRPGQSFTATGLAEQLAIVPRHHRVLERYLQILEEDGLLQRLEPGAAWEVVRVPHSADPLATWRSLVAEYPAFIAELMLLGRCGQHLAPVLRGESDALQLIFNEGGLATAEHFYQDSPCNRFHHGVAQVAVARLLEHFPEDRPLRILEIGAGVGGLTSYVLPLLPAGRAHYVFTDLSNHSITKAEQKFQDFPFVVYKRLDVERNPAEQEFEDHSFDLILASQVLHATADLRQTLQHVHQLLSPGGLLMALEAVRPPRWFDLVFGLLEGWWRFTDVALRPSHPLMALSTWQRLLEEVGFTEPTDLCRSNDEGPFESAVILTRSPDHGETRKPEPEQVKVDVVPDSPSRWLLFADRGGVGEKLAALLTAQGETCTVVFAGDGFAHRSENQYQVVAGSQEEMRRLLEAILQGDRPPWRGIVHLWNLDAPHAETASTDMVEAAQTSGCLSVVQMLQAWTDMAGSQSPRLYLVTAGAHAIRTADSVAVVQTPVWGLGRVIDNEFPHLRTKLVDLCRQPSRGGVGGECPRNTSVEVASLFHELWSEDQEDEIGLRGLARYVHRYTRRPLDRPTRQHEPGRDSYRLEVSRSSTLDGLTLRSLPRRPPGPGEVEVEVCAAALNFSDVMKALGLYPGLPDGPVPLGLECSGRIAAVGAGVEDFKVGDEVVAVAQFSFSAFLTMPAQVVARKPRHLSFEEAATIPIAFLTAEYALNYLGRMEKGDRVLIHSATGGVGLAAIQLAWKAGAEIFATAGTPEKREFLQSLGVRHVMDSRSLAFADEVMERTGGRGVDLVLNSLAGEAIPKGLSCLADHGRFLEIGKRDIYQNSRVGLAPFRKNLSLIAIDLDRGLRERPARFAALFRSLVEEFEQNRLAPLPHRVFPIANVVGAFRHMAQGKHLGKVVLSLQEQSDPLKIVPRSNERQSFRADATYLITGGLGGFGLSVAQWLAAQGARHLVLASRRGVTGPDVQQAVDVLEQAGVQVVIARTDVSCADKTAALLDQVARTMPPLRGVFHAAMVLDDCLLLNLNQERLQRVFGPKMSGAWNLHTGTLRLPLDFFVLFSSMSCILGVPGQANYAAANAFLDALAHYRRGRGLPALAVDWGYLGNVGVVARNEKIGAGFEQMGVTSFTSGEALTLLGRLLQQDAPQVGVMKVNWGQQRKLFGAAAVPPMFSQLYDEAASDANSAAAEGATGRNSLLAAPPEKRKELLLGLLRDKVARVLGSAAARLDLDKPLTESGLDSLMAVELRNWIEGELRLTLPIVELMRGPSVARLADALLQQLSGADAPPAAAAAPVKEAAPAEYPLSAGQRDLWFVQRLAPEGTAYNLADAVRFRGPLDAAAVMRALQTVVDRHPALRTTFAEVDGRPLQRVKPSQKAPFEVLDASGWSEAELRQRLVTESQKTFDLENGPTMRVVLLRRGPEEHILLFMMHHLVADLWSLVLCSREFLLFYEAEKRGQPAVVPPPATTYSDFVRWQTAMLAGPEGERLRSYWSRQLAGELPVLNLPTDRPRPAVQTYRGAWLSHTLSRDLTQALKTFSQEHSSTPFMTLLAAYQVLLHRYTGQEEILVGCPTMGRSRTEFAPVAGYFVNPVVLRGDLSNNPSFAELLEHTRRTVLDAFDHQEYPFGLLVEQLQPKRDPGRSPIFQTMFLVRKAQGGAGGVDAASLTNFLMEQSTARVTMAGLEAEALDLQENDAQFELSLQVAEVEGCLMSAMQYNSDLFDAETITRWLLHWETLLAGIVAQSEQRLSELPLLPSDERQRVLVDWTDTQVCFPDDQCIHQLFELQVLAQPDAPAVVHENRTLTYGDLNQRANQLAHRLRTLGVGPDVMVGLCVNRSLDMVVGLLGILKAGGAYLPLDPEYPQERLAFMVQDAQVPVLVTQEGLRQRFAGQAPNMICLDADAACLAQESTDNPVAVSDPEHLAYVIYTSGSTSKPRGVLIEHRSLVNHNVDFLRRYGLQSSDRVLQFASISFDTAAEELFPALLAGATVVLRSTQATTSLTDFLNWLGEQRLTVVDLPTSYWHFWVSELTRTELPWPETLRWVIVGGEKVLPERLATWLDKIGPRVNWSNGYGPTEAAIQTTTFSVISNPDTAGIADDETPEMRPASSFDPRVVPIGRPIANTSVYLLDAHWEPVPIGVAGEIWIGGIGLARGYLNQPEMTESRFIMHALPGQPPRRLYRTGDLARFLPDGNLEFIGRIDHQVKIRGYRIELAEVEARLAEHPALAETVVLAREDEPGQRRLVAYVVAKPQQPLRVADLRGFLKERLPGYMIPSAFVLLPALPMTPNGKLDRQALPVPELLQEEERDYTPPRTAEEHTLAEIWAEVLGAARVGITDNFFDLGGDSIQSLQMISRARQAGLHVTPRQMYQYQTIADLVAAGLQPAGPAVEPELISEQGPIPLTPIQHWFFEQQLGELGHWNQAFQIDVETVPEERMLENVTRQFLHIHDALRLRFHRDSSGWQQSLASAEGAVPFSRVDLGALSETEQEAALARATAELQGSLDVTLGPLVRVALFERGGGKPARLMLVIHHLVIDSVSWRILLQDFLTAMGQMGAGQPIELLPATLSFHRYARLLTEMAGTPAIQQDANFWIEQGRRVPTAPLPLDHEQGENTRASAESVWLSLEEIETRLLLQHVSGAAEYGMDALLATALARTLAHWSGHAGALIDLEGHGRAGLPADVDLSHTVGWLASIYPLWLGTTGSPLESLRYTAEQLRQTPHHGLSYGILRYLADNAEVSRVLREQPQAAVRLNYIGQLDHMLMASASIAPVHRSSGHIHQIAGFRRYLLECNGHIADGRLRLGLTYSRNLHERETVERLVKEMLAEVRALCEVVERAKS
jgi:amino acid adenylation domain-containing protein/non-ribosomal peptide synthase protein (TIGR01720 family)